MVCQGPSPEVAGSSIRMQMLCEVLLTFIACFRDAVSAVNELLALQDGVLNMPCELETGQNVTYHLQSRRGRWNNKFPTSEPKHMTACLPEFPTSSYCVLLIRRWCCILASYPALRLFRIHACT